MTSMTMRRYQPRAEYGIDVGQPMLELHVDDTAPDSRHAPMF